MTTKAMILAAFGAAALALPAAASAQPNYGQAYGQAYGWRVDDDRPRGDFDRDRRTALGVYPEFRDIEMHIRREIDEGVRRDLIERDDARDLAGQLRDIQAREMREFRIHGWKLPGDDRARIRADLDRLDHLVDQIRAEG